MQRETHSDTSRFTPGSPSLRTALTFCTGSVLFLPYVPQFPAGLVGLALAILLALMVTQEGGGRGITYGAVVFVALYGILGFAPALSSAEASGLVLRDGLRYTLVLGLLAMGAGKTISRTYRSFFAGIVFGALALAIPALLAILVQFAGGGANFMGTRSYHPEAIGSWAFPTSSSFLWNTNYYGTALTLALWIHVITNPLKNSRPGYIGVLVLLAAGAFFSGSRSTMALLIILPMFYFACKPQDRVRKLHASQRSRKRFTFRFSLQRILVLLGLVVLGSFMISANSELPLVEFFTDKGLNNRDNLASAAGVAFLARPQGYGFSGFGAVLFEHGAETTTPQNSYLAYLLIGGPALFILVVGSLLLALAARTRINAVDEPPASLEMIILVIVVIESFFRTYIIGGIGLMPFLLSWLVIRTFDRRWSRNCA